MSARLSDMLTRLKLTAVRDQLDGLAATTVVAQLAKAHSEGRLEERLAQFAKPKLLIIDELGYLPLSPMPRICSSSSLAAVTSEARSCLQATAASASGARSSATPWLPPRSLIVCCTTATSSLRGDRYRLKEKRRSRLLQKPAVPDAKSEKKS